MSLAFASPAVTTPAGQQERMVTFTSADATQDFTLVAYAYDGAYQCDAIVQGAYQPLPAGATCEVDPSTGTFEVAVPDTGFTIGSVSVSTSGYHDGGMWLTDTAGPFTCP